MAAKVFKPFLGEQGFKGINVEQVNSHRPKIWAFRLITADHFLEQLGIGWFLCKLGDLKIAIAFEDPKAVCFICPHGLNCHGNVGFCVPVEPGHGIIIHAVKMVASQDEHIFCPGGDDFKELFSNCICRPLVPVGGFCGLLCSPNLHPSGMEIIKLVGPGDMPVQRNRIKLGQHSYVIDLRVDAIADGDIDQPVFSCDRHCRF